MASIWNHLRHQIYLGDDAFMERVQRFIKIEGHDLAIPKAHRRPPPAPIEHYEQQACSRDDAIIQAYRTGGYTYRELADHFGLHLSSIGRIVRASMTQ